MRLLLLYFFLISIFCFSQKRESVDFTHIEAKIAPYVTQNRLWGQAILDFLVKEKTDSIFINAQNFNFSSVKLNGKPIKYRTLSKKIAFKAPKRLGKHQVKLQYTAKPIQSLYFIQNNTLLPSKQTWTQGQGKYTRHWLPSFDDMNEKVEIDLTIIANSKYSVIANGKLRAKREMNLGHVFPAPGKEKEIVPKTLWKFDMTNQMSSYLAAFVIGDFDKKVLQSKSGVPIELYYEPKDSLRFEPTYRYTKEIFDFMEAEIGVPYPWQNYKQVPVRDFLYAGMENTTCTIFSNQYVIDSTAFVDKNYVNVNAHELAHQWFGNLVTEESGDHHWLHEGFATYYAYLAEKELFGDNHFYWKLFQTAKTLHNLSENEGGEALTDPNANSLTFYEKGAWALVALRDRVGDTAFKKGIRGYLRTYAYDNASIAEFLAEMGRASEMDLSAFREKWLQSEEFPWLEAKNILIKNAKTLKTYFDLKRTLAEQSNPFSELVRLWNGLSSEELKIQLIKDYNTTLLEGEFIQKLEDESVKVRQTFIVGMDSIPREFQGSFESFLTDQSYITQEALLFRLWQAFPENRSRYLSRLDGVDGLPNKNVRLLWLTLALITEDYRTSEKKVFYDELNSFTSSYYNFEVRQAAFQYLYQIQAMNDTSLKNLLDASTHHVWQFKKSSRNLLREINQSERGKERLAQLPLNEEEKERLKAILNP